MGGGMAGSPVVASKTTGDLLRLWRERKPPIRSKSHFARKCCAYAAHRSGGRAGPQPRSGGVASFARAAAASPRGSRSEEHTSELQSLMRISYAVFCLKTQQ